MPLLTPPDFDSNNYLPTDTLHFYLAMQNIEGEGGEELAFTNAVTPPSISEPGILALMGLGLQGLGYSRRYKLSGLV